ncbi:AAA family ATPase [uncultured Treponema sp.]|uniref:AAA family ATPase n=1 Tax=uncultured Treponema sp. TaxID=162155 RepID=UPI0025F73FAE|nr:AAA family ATPase [uncultured Treponema sp.]
MNLKEKFKEWMTKQKKEDGTEYSLNTINSYCSQLNSAPAKLDIQNCYKISIFEYSDLKFYRNVENIIFNASNFDEVNKNAGNQALKYGMLKYEEFLAKLQKDRNQLADNLTGNLTSLLQHTHNLILHGAPGTGKTFLAKQIAERIGCSPNEIGFVQFHPSYDYTDFVEGLRPKSQNNGEIGFERKDGVFKEFCKRALQNLIDSKKSVEVLEKESSIKDKVENFLEKARNEKIVYEITRGNKFFIVDNSEKNIFIEIPANEKVKELALSKNDLIELLNSDVEINSANEIRDFFKRKWGTQHDSYILTLYKKIRAETQTLNIQKVEKVQKKKFLFIIDEINRGELSKIFGELFYAVEPGYRVSYDDLKKHQSGEKTISTICTQYANLEVEKNEFDKVLCVSNPADYGHFFIPENVYIIGTMNDIDRSVDTMDFAFRRRFAFKEIKAAENLEMLSTLGEIKDEAEIRLAKLNSAITEITELSSPSSYHIGGAYFLKLKDFDGDSNERFQKLWTYHLEGLLKEYLRGTENAEENFEKLKNAYFSSDSTITNNSEEEGE